MDEITVKCLGPLELCVGGRPLRLTTGRLRTLVVVLAMSAGRVVSFDRLADAVWADAPPVDARASLQTYKSRLRGLLGPGSMRVLPTGYALRVAPDDVDAVRFDRLVASAGRASGPVEERALLGEAMALWRGTPFEDVRSTQLEQSETPRLLEGYLVATERCVDLDIAAGRTTDLAPLEELATRFPLRESLWVRLLVVLDRHDRTAEALARYETIRDRIADEFGVDPGVGLQQVYRRLLARMASAATLRIAADQVVPRQLPPDSAGFVGRRAASRTLDDLPGREQTVAITGAAGVGKTTLAVHWAHRVADRFPDGQLYVDLRGFDPSGRPKSPDQAMAGFLQALRIPARRIPSAFDAQVRTYRGLLEGRRMLVVLDNAAYPEQVRPLLPCGPDCLAVVTSRSRLPGLVGHRVELGPFSDDEAWRMLANRLGQGRIAGGRTAVTEVVRLCSRLPLALAIVAARAAAQPDLGFDALAAELRERHAALDALSTSDDRSDLRAVFSWSYQILGADAARLFRLLSLHPGPDFALSTAASIAGVTTSRARALLSELDGVHLVVQHAPGRYLLHYLLRVHAFELSLVHDSEVERRAALRRMLGYYPSRGRERVVRSPA